jgi:glycosyltransferase involved in cell wall biosynthesis
MDLLVLSSISEGFPNVIGEAMSCGLPIVATDVGDCRAIVGERGWIVPARDPAALAEGMAAAIAELDSWNPDVSRQRIERLYSVAAMVESTEAILQKVQMA